MAIEVNTVVSVGEAYGGKKSGNLTLEDAKFFGRPNFSGELDSFKDDRRKFTVLIPNDVADQLRDMGWNVKTKIPTPEELAEHPDREMISSLKVFLNFKFDEKHPGDINYEKGPDIWILMGEEREKLNSRTVGILDRSRIESLDMEIRGWEYDPDEKPGELSARLVQLVATIRPNILQQKYGRLA